MVKRWLRLLLAAPLLAGCLSQQPMVADQPTAEPFRFTVLQMNDVYEIAPLEGGRVGGLARVASLLRSLEAENPHTLAVLSGDFLSPSFAATLKLPDGQRVAGLQMVETLNALGLDYVTFGNHEFDYREAAILESRMDASDFRWISCNVLHEKGGEAQPFTQRGEPIPSYVVHTFRSGSDSLRVAFVGVVLPFARVPYVRYLPVEEAFEKAYTAAAAAADLVIGLTHLTVEEDESLARAVPGPALFMGGHEHENLSRYIENTAVTKADANAKTVYVHRFTVDPRTGLYRLRSTLVPIDARLPDEPATRAVVDRWQARVNDILQAEGYRADRVIGEAVEPLEGRESMVRSRQTNYGQLAARSFAAALPGADVYLLNSGSIRVDDKLSGSLTEYDVLRSFPFGGGIVRTQWPGSVLSRVLEAGSKTNFGKGGYLQLYQAAPQPDGSWLIGGRPLDEQRSYTVVLPEFVAQGNEANLQFLSQYPYEKPATLGNNLRNDVRSIIIAWMEQQGRF